MEENCYYQRLPDEEPLKELKSMLSDTFKNKQISMWRIPINMESSDTTETEKADVILLKFLTAKNLRVQDAYNMLIKCLEWRKAYGVESIVEQDLGFKTLENLVCYNMGCDRQGRSVSYTNYSYFFELVAEAAEYEHTKVYKQIFCIDENQKKFIKWRIQVIDRLIRMLSFKPGGVNSIVLVQDCKYIDFNHRFSRPLIDVNEKIFLILRDNYPGMISYQVLLNVPWICRAGSSLRSLFNRENESMMWKVVISKESSVPETLYKYISPEHIPQLYGGFYGDDNLKTVPCCGIMAKGRETSTFTIEGIRAHAEVWVEVVAGGSYFEYSCILVPDEVARLATMVKNPVKKIQVRDGYTISQAGKLVISIRSQVTKLVTIRYKVQNLEV